MNSQFKLYNRYGCVDLNNLTWIDVSKNGTA